MQVSSARGFTFAEERSSIGGGEAIRDGSGSFDADNRGLVFTLRRGLGGFSMSICSSSEVRLGSSSSQIPGTFGGRDKRFVGDGDDDDVAGDGGRRVALGRQWRGRL